MKKTIVVEPERTETYTEMVPCTKTRIIPAKTIEQEVGGYITVYRWVLDGERRWTHEKSSSHVERTADGFVKDPVKAMEQYQTPSSDLVRMHGSEHALLYVPPGVTIKAALEAFNSLSK